MKVIVIGLGNFGANLGLALMEKNNEVIGVDMRINKVEMYKDHLTYTICMDSTDEIAIQNLPLKDSDYIIVSIGEDIGASITTTALLKKNNKQAIIIGRAISPIHATILETMGIGKIIHPEASFAQDLANSMQLKGSLKMMQLDNHFEIVEIEVPDCLVGKTLQESNLRQLHHLNLVTLLRESATKNLLGQKSSIHKSIGVPLADTVFIKKDILVLFGKNKDIELFMQKHR